MKNKSLITVLSLLFYIVMINQNVLWAEQNCIVVSTSTDVETLKKLYGKHNAQPLLVFEDSVYYCPCGARNIGGSTEDRNHGGDSEARNIGGSTEGRNHGGDNEARQIGGSTEGRSHGGQSEARQIGGSTEGRDHGGDNEARNIGGSTEGRNHGGDSEARNHGGDNEARNIGGSTEGRDHGGDSEDRDFGGNTSTLTCQIKPPCKGFIINNIFTKTISWFDGIKVISSNNTCIY